MTIENCPFCGSDDLHRDTLPPDNIIGCIYCDNCGASGPRGVGVEEIDELWNKALRPSGGVVTVEFSNGSRSKAYDGIVRTYPYHITSNKHDREYIINCDNGDTIYIPRKNVLTLRTS